MPAEPLVVVGIGADGDIAAGQLSLLPRRPLGIATVDNPTATHDWAPPETLEDARSAAPRRARTLDRVGRIVEMYAQGHQISCVAGDPRLDDVLREADAVIVTASTYPLVATRDVNVPLIVVRFHIEPQSVEYLRTAVQAHSRRLVQGAHARAS